MEFESFRDFASFEIVAIGGTPVTPTRIAIFLLVVMIAGVVSRWVRFAVQRAWRRRGIEDDGALRASLRLMHYVVLLTGMAIGLQVVGIRLSALFAAGAVLAVGIGFATQTLVQNFVSGVILLVERSIKPGDILVLDDELVRVTEMGIRRTIVRTLFDEDIIVPNGILVQSAVKNLTYSDKLYRLHIEVGVTYASDLDKTKATLERAARAVSFAEDEPAPLVLLRGFGASSVDFQVSIWIRSPWVMYRARSELLFSIWNALHEEKIVIAFPQLDVHFDGPVTSALEKLGRTAA